MLDLLRFGLRGSGSDFIMMLVMGALAGGLGLLPALVTGALFDTVIPTANRAMLAQLALALVTAALATALFQLVRSFAVLRLEQRISTATQAAVWDRLLNLPAPFFDAFSAGDLTARVSGIDQIRQTLTGVTLTTVLTGAFSLFNLGLLFVYDWRLAGLALALLLIAVVVTLVCGRRALRYTRPLNLMQSKLAGLVLQLVGGIARLRVAGAERRAFAVWAERFAELRRLSFMAGNADNFLAVFNAAFPSLALATLFAWAAFQGGAPSRTTGAMLAFVSAFSSLLIATLSASENILAILRIVPLYENARPILATLPEVSVAKVHPGILSGAIAVNHVTFRYRPDGLVVLNDVSFEAKPGEFVAIVGPSGSGKSTLLRLLLGFGAPELGAICYDDQDLGALDLQELRRQIGVVLQNTRLLPGDIFSNIVGTSLLTLDDAWAAARLAGLEDNIRQMPMGMHTVIGAGASTFSGGQRQRLAIARAVASRPRILFFDEATSALDNRTQAIVSQSLEVLQATRIVIAHRLSTIAHADRIYVMMAGRVAQCGCYAELIEQDGPFRELARRQVLTTL